MTTITLNLSPELEQQIRTEASRQGLEPDRYILNALQERLQPRLPTTQPTEADLLQQINIGFSAQTWEEYHALIAQASCRNLDSRRTQATDPNERSIALNNSMLPAFKP